MINEELVKQLDLTQEQVNKIKHLQGLRSHLFDIMTNEDNPETLKNLDKQCVVLEYKLQEAWGFEQNVAYHKFWYRPKCTCPYLDNEDRYPSGYYIVNDSCVLHGGLIE